MPFFPIVENILYQKQLGFQNAHSTGHAFSQGKYTLSIFIYLSKVLDTVNHNILLKKIKAYGIC